MKQKTINKNELVIDGTNATLGRLASYAAKQTLLGKNIVIVNSNEVVVVGTKEVIMNKYMDLVKKGGSSLKGPKIARNPERIVKRTIRGMVPHKQYRGSEAIRRVMCYNETPEEYKDVKKIRAGKEKRGKFTTLKQLVNLIK